MTRARVSVLGLGPMGSAIATTLSDHADVTVWNRTRARADALVDRVTVADSPSRAVAAADLVIVSLLDNRAVTEVLAAVGTDLGASTVVNLTSDTPATARAVADQIVRQGARCLGGVMLTPATSVGQPSSTMLVAGEQAALQRAKDLLTVIAPRLSVIGTDPSGPAVHDLALLDVFWTTFVGWTHALAVGRAHGLSADDLTERLQNMVRLAADVGLGISADVTAGKYPGTTSTTRSAVATLRHIVEASRDAAVDASLPASVLALLEKAAAIDPDAAPSRVFEQMTAAS